MYIFKDKSNISLLSELSTSAAFENDLCSIYAFLNAIHLKTLPEKEDFFKYFIIFNFKFVILLIFRTIVERMSLLPPRVVAKRLSRLILSRYVLLEPLSHIFLYPCFLTPKSWFIFVYFYVVVCKSINFSVDEDSDGIFPLELYRDYVITEVVRVFLVRLVVYLCCVFLFTLWLFVVYIHDVVVYYWQHHYWCLLIFHWCYCLLFVYYLTVAVLLLLFTLWLFLVYIHGVVLYSLTAALLMLLILYCCLLIFYCCYCLPFDGQIVLLLFYSLSTKVM